MSMMIMMTAMTINDNYLVPIHTPISSTNMTMKACKLLYFQALHYFDTLESLPLHLMYGGIDELF